jgi:N-acyl-D-aspartate/D-glutamate deacylase
VFSLEEAVRRLASMSADVIGVRDRGRLQPGQAADLVLFDANEIAAGERETFDDVPGGGTRIVQRAVGVEQVFVNGDLLVERGQQHDVQPGRVLRRG